MPSKDRPSLFVSAQHVLQLVTMLLGSMLDLKSSMHEAKLCFTTSHQQDFSVLSERALPVYYVQIPGVYKLRHIGNATLGSAGVRVFIKSS